MTDADGMRRLFRDEGLRASSYKLCYSLVWGPIAVFAQRGWGGVYMDPDESAAAVRDLFGQCADLIDAAAAARPRLKDPWRRLVVESRIGGGRYGWADGHGYTPLEEDRTGTVLAKAADLLRTGG
ncbi:hypothetical protein [Actinomadura sp. NPDC048394]|jgi:hypothetical protein|uniref:hypothetical protein n=1 Tax=Actinomadura sp. NPDC048394 TaxID=3158223 RepID=UPI00340696D2